MAYEFSFDGKSLWALGGGSAVLCLLLFFAGVLLGANWGPQDAAAAAGAQAQPAPVPQPAPATQPAVASAAPRSYAATPPQEPVVYDLPVPRDYAAQGYAPQGYAARVPEPADFAAQQRHAAPPATAADATSRSRREVDPP
ncbi:MAG TPA: hypothetical protein VG148_01010 [Pyrinomonadaceae bacterium]|nr:hypothetical protein [Pyrinomonadaceae bacterium]